MSTPTGKQWGITPPISTQLPTPTDVKLNEDLIKELKDNNNYESPEETQKRTDVLKSLQKITVEFVKLVMRNRSFSQTAIDSAGGKIFTFGSFRLGVFGPGSDIDTLVVVNKHVTREDFFEHFPPLLRKMAPKDAISELKPVVDAFVPIIKLEYSNISIDLIFSSLLQETVPTGLDLKDNSLLRGLGETDLRCLNGTRVTDEILASVPQIKTFRVALRAIKLWAQRRAIYANVMGFPGGVAWAMMVARICQFYPQAAGSTIVHRFFTVISTWQWPMPIQLKYSEEGPALQNVRIWNPMIYPGDKRHLMPVITPAYPQMCSTHNITYSTKEIILRELIRAKGITDSIVDGKAKWKALFEKHKFFSEGYRYYLSIVAASRTKEAQLIWSGLVESKVRRLVASIEQMEGDVKIAHPFNKGFERVHTCKDAEQIDEVLQGSLKYQASNTKTELTDSTNDPAHKAAAEDASNQHMALAATLGEKEAEQNGEQPQEDLEPKQEQPKEVPLVEEQLTEGQPKVVESTEGQAKQEQPHEEESNGDRVQTIHTTTYYVGIELKPDAKSLDISYPVGEFKRMCTDWQQYDENLNSIRIVHTRSYDLPDDVFAPGEVRPHKGRKSKAGKNNEVASKKRSLAESSLEQAAETNGTKRRASAAATNGSATPQTTG